MKVTPVADADAPSPICRATLRVHAFRAYALDDVRCRDCGLVMPLSAALRDGPEARHCLECGWWTSEDECAAGGERCVWCKRAFDD